jgi:hypothetical protein
MEGRKMSADNQAGRRRGERKAKRPARKESAAQPVPSFESYLSVAVLILSQEVPEFDPAALASSLLIALEKGGDTMPAAAYKAILGVAACLHKELLVDYHSDRLAQEVIKKARAA